VDVRRDAARYVIPHYPDPDWRLPNAEDVEEPLLRRLGATPVPPRQAEVLALLERQGEVDLLHFGCHGSADAGQIDSSALWLEGEVVDQSGQAAWVKESLLASTVAQFARLRGRDGRRPIVVVNACQTGRSGRALTGLGGFAFAFIGPREGSGDSRGRAAAFVGALWSVGDAPATTFVDALYAALRAGRSMSAASRQARQAARRAGEATWLSYAVYAHPLLRVRWPA
jgi:CHAT domain-containing protein